MVKQLEEARDAELSGVEENRRKKLEEIDRARERRKQSKEKVKRILL